MHLGRGQQIRHAPPRELPVLGVRSQLEMVRHDDLVGEDDIVGAETWLAEAVGRVQVLVNPARLCLGGGAV
jgi:hypothetical protein